MQSLLQFDNQTRPGSTYSDGLKSWLDLTAVDYKLKKLDGLEGRYPTTPHHPSHCRRYPDCSPCQHLVDQITSVHVNDHRVRIL
eukprot:scaffold643932_cov18-Prasinocladus_malaysianus.AAC.2